jgi:thiol-disulfide isomerase/thioredoxin
VAAGVAALVAIASLLVVILPGGQRSALAVMQEAQRNFEQVPPFRATMLMRVSGDVIGQEFPEHSGEDWMSRQELWYGGEEGWRRDIVVDNLPFMRGGAGSFAVFDGGRTGVYRASEDTYVLQEGEDVVFSPLLELNPGPTGTVGKSVQTRAGAAMSFDAYFEQRCERLPDGRVASRRASHLTCEDGHAEVWLDVETGLILRFTTPDFAFEIETIGYRPAFPPEAFDFEPPAGATNVGEDGPPGAGTSLQVGKIVPSWSGNLLGGGRLDLTQLRGKPVAVFFWASWCPPCTGGALDGFVAAHAEHEGSVNFVSVAYDGEEATKSFLDEEGPLPFAIVIDEQGEIPRLWAVEGIPMLVLLDAEGRFLMAVLGSDLNPQVVDRLIDSLASGGTLREIAPSEE